MKDSFVTVAFMAMLMACCSPAANGYAADAATPNGVAAIRKGLTKAEVRSRAGEPDCIIVKANPKENGFAQAENESLIKEGWFYNTKGRKGSGAEVFFDVNGVVIRRTAGSGLIQCTK